MRQYVFYFDVVIIQISTTGKQSHILNAWDQPTF